MTPLDYHTLWVFLLELLEISASWWFYAYTNGNPKLDSWLMPTYLAWVICATTRWAIVRIGWALVPSRDVYSYFAFLRALRAQQKVNPSRQHEDALYEQAQANGNAAAMMPGRRKIQMIVTAVVLHGINALLVGISHTQDRITEASATSQVPSIWLASFYVCRTLCFAPKIPPSTGTLPTGAPPASYS